MGSEQTRALAICAKGGCGAVSNGVAPYGYCARHFRGYMEWLAGRTKLESFVRLSLAVVAVGDDDATRPLLQAGAVAVDALLSESDPTGLVMDEIAAAAEALAYVRPSFRKGVS